MVFHRFYVVSAVLLGLAIVSVAQGNEEADWRDKIKYGADLRVRETAFDNALDFLDSVDDERHFFRVRGRVWTAFGPFFEDPGLGMPNGLSGFVRVTAEPRWHVGRPDDFPAYGSQSRDHVAPTVTHEEAVLDNFWLQWARPGGLPVTLKAGRLDAVYGYEPPYGRGGWVIFEGTPLDGSRTIYQDGAIATIHMDDWRSQLDLMWFDNAARPEDRIETLGESDIRVAEGDIDFLGAYFKKEIEDRGCLRDMKFHTYYLWKKDRPVDDDGQHGRPDYTNMVGALMQGKNDGNVDFYAEAGYQWGSHYNRSGGQNMRQDREAWGATAEVGYTFADCTWKPRVSGGWEYLTGDDPSTDEWEQWDPMLARWPHWSELFAYRWAFEGGLPGCYHNLQRFSLGTMFTPLNRPDAERLQRLHAAFYYHYLLADEHTLGTSFNPPLQNYDDGDTRGSLLTGKLTWKWNENVSGHFLGEYFTPGDFYADQADEAWFLRWQIAFKLPVPRKN